MSGGAKKIISSIAGLGFPLTKNTRSLLKLKGKHKNQRCFVIGNGPSLRMSDLDQLKDEITFASNKIYLAFEQTQWRPTYYTVEDALVAKNNAEVINRMKGFIKIFPNDLKCFLKQDPGVIYVNFPRDYKAYPQFSRNILSKVYWGSTVLYMDLQLAYYMGITEVYLMGVDFEFKTPKRIEGNMVISSGECNHFSPQYRKPGERWYLPRLDRQIPPFQLAKRIFEEDGRIVYNATRGGKLEIFPRRDFDSVVNNEK